MDILIVGIICYLIGSIPFGYILTKIFLKKDIRDIGSGNIGATNALRTGNKTIGYATLFFDIVKAVIPIIYIIIPIRTILGEKFNILNKSIKWNTWTFLIRENKFLKNIEFSEISRFSGNWQFTP